MNSEEDTAPLQEAERAHREATPFANVVPVRHTRRCNGRTICSCILRVESAYFHKKLVENAAKKRRVNDSAAAIATTTTTMTRKYQKVTNIQGLQLDIKSHIASFLTPLALGRLGMVRPRQNVMNLDECWCIFDNTCLTLSCLSDVIHQTSKKFKSDVNTMAKQATETFLAHASMDKLLTQQKPKATESWSQFMHNQLTCIHKLFVYYTGYKTGPMRQQFPHWAFGVVHVDPNAPHCRILPNTWTFHGHHPWLRRRGNGKDGEWLLSKKYTGTNAPSDFVVHVKSWASTLRPGSMLAVAYQNAGSEEPAWWEAQAWYLWRGDGKQDPAIVYDPETEAHIQVHPDDLFEHFKAHPLHVIDVCKKPGAVCRPCASRNRTFKYCHIDKGHPML